jgi:8-hydroxy-5-deazaflavin:NADPH oxidoreductase
MKISILGTGMVGQTLAAKINSLGHQVMLGTRNVEAAVSRSDRDNFGNPGFGEWYKANGWAKLGTIAEAVTFGEMIINASQGASSVSTLQQANPGDFSDKVILDIANPLDFSRGMPPSLYPELSNTNSVGEEIQRTFPQAHVVKTLNTMNCGLMVNPGSLGNGDHINFICGNDTGAKEKVKSLLIEFGWKEKNIFDLGDISAARTTEALVPLWVRIMSVKQSVAFNFKIVE